jgi:hypothetical protein
MESSTPGRTRRSTRTSKAGADATNTPEIATPTRKTRGRKKIAKVDETVGEENGAVKTINEGIEEEIKASQEENENGGDNKEEENKSSTEPTAEIQDNEDEEKNEDNDVQLKESTTVVTVRQ